MTTVVTLSASYGTGGSVVGPAVAERLGVPFVDRAIPVAVAEELAVPLQEALARDESRRSSRIGRLLADFARAAAPDPMIGVGSVNVPNELTSGQSDVRFREATERVLREAASGEGGVILGRAGAIVLRDVPGALHVRLDAPVEARIAHAVATATEPVDEATARRHLADTDRAREAYVRHFYKVDPNDACLYHLVIDATVFATDTIVELIVCAAHARGAGRTA